MTALQECPLNYERLLNEFHRGCPFSTIESSLFFASKVDSNRYPNYFSDPWVPKYNDGELRDAFLNHFKRKVGLAFNVEDKEFWRKNKLVQTYLMTGYDPYQEKALDRRLNLLSGELTFSRFFYELSVNFLQGFPLFRSVDCKIKDGPVDLEYARKWNMLSESQISGYQRTRELSTEEIARLAVLTDITKLFENKKNLSSRDTDTYGFMMSLVNMPHPDTSFKLHWAGQADFDHSKYIRKGWVSPPPPAIKPLSTMEIEHLLALAYSSQDPILKEYFETNMAILQRKLLS